MYIVLIMDDFFYFNFSYHSPVAVNEPNAFARSLIVRRVKDLLGLIPLELISRLLRGQVSLACKSSKPLYIKRGDISI